MDRRERLESLQASTLAMLDARQADLWTALPGIIQSYDPAKNTAVVQPAIQARLTSVIDGSVTDITLPVLVDCPVKFPSGGGFILTFPLVEGDECLVVFSSRCIDAWWQSGGIQPQARVRMHDLSDGFVLPGVTSVPRVPTGISTSQVQLRTWDGSTAIGIDSGKNVNITVNGNANVTASGTAKVSAASILLQNTGAALKTLLNSAFAAWAAAHTHPANNTPPSTPPPANGETSVVQAE